MIDIDVEGDRRYGVIEQGSRAHRALRQLRTDLITARLSSADGSRPSVSAEHIGRVLGFKTNVLAIEVSHLVRIGVLDPIMHPSVAAFDRSTSYSGEVTFHDSYATMDRSRYSYFNKPGANDTFALAESALEALNKLRAGEDIARFPFP